MIGEKALEIPTGGGIFDLDHGRLSLACVPHPVSGKKSSNICHFADTSGSGSPSL